MRVCCRNAFGGDDARRQSGWRYGRLLLALAVTAAASCAPANPPVERPVTQMQRVQPVATARRPPKHLMTAPREPSCATEGPRSPETKVPGLSGGQAPA